MSIRIRSLLPPGGFYNLVGHYVAALDIGSEKTRAAAEACPDAATACAVLRDIGELESTWIHQSVGDVPTPPAPEDDSDLAAWLGWMEAVRTISVMVLRPKEDRDLESMVSLPDEDPALGPRTLKRLLAELLYEEGRLAGRL